MNLPPVFSNRRFRWMAVAVAATALIMITINVFVIGGDQFVYTLNSSINSPLAALVAISGGVIWRSMSKDKYNRILWSGILIGWALWALAEIIWSIYSVLGQEVPYPGIADFFWVIGYIPLGIGLITRSMTMPVKANRRQSIFIVGISIVTIVVALFAVILPTVQEFDPQRIYEGILNLTYPLGDLILLVIVWRLFFTYEAGDYGFGWTLITLGFIFNSVADFVFLYSTWQGSYYPDMQANLISRLGTDVPYTLSYLLWFIGIYALGIMLNEKPPLEPGARVRLVRTYGNILIYTKKDDTVMDVSPNFEQFFGTGNVRGKTLAQALAIPAAEAQSMLDKLRVDGKLTELPVQIRNRSGNPQDARLSGVAIFGPHNAYFGSNILLRMRITDTSFDAALKEESRQMVKFVLEKSGSNAQAEVGQFLADYYLSYVKSMLDMAFHQGGTTVSQALLNQFEELSKKHNWQLRFKFETVLDDLDYPLDVLREALPALLELSKRFVAEIINPAAVEARMQQVRSRFSDSILRDVEFYQKVGNEVGFADHRKGPDKPR